MAKNRGFSNAAYSTKRRKRCFFGPLIQPFNTLGKQRIPNTSSNPQNLQLPEFSDSYLTWNAQIAHNFNKTSERISVGKPNWNSTKKSDCRCSKSFQELF